MNTRQPCVKSLRWRYGWLALWLLLLLGNLAELPEELHSKDAGRFSNLIVCLMLISGHVTFWLVPPGRLKAVLLAFDKALMVFAFAYVFTKGFSGFLFL